MAITFVGGYAASDGGSGNTTDPATMVLPTHQSGDVGYLFAGHTISGTSYSAFVAVSGWTSLGTVEWTAGSDGQVELWRRVFTSSSETNPVVNTDVSGRKSASVLVFRGVDNTTPEDVTVVGANQSNLTNSTNGAITPTTNNGGLVLFQYHLGAASSQLATLGAPTTPTGLTLLSSGSGSLVAGANHRDLAAAYKLDYGTASTITPTAWTHTVVGSPSNEDEAETGAFTIALRPATATAKPHYYYAQL